MELIGLKSELISAGDDLVMAIVGSLNLNAQSFNDSDLLVVSAKVVAVSEENFANESEMQNLIYKEADVVFPGPEAAKLTITKGIPTPNAGIDRSNAADGQIILWPNDPQKSADELRDKLVEKFGLKDFGVLLIDSCCWPLRRGTNALCLAYSGIVGVEDQRGTEDLFGRKLQITQVALADQLAAAANLLMGEAAEATPFVLVKNAPVKFTNSKTDSVQQQQMPINECLWGSILNNK